MTDVIVGVDCGGSKTLAVVGTTSSQILGRGTAGAANPVLHEKLLNLFL